MNYYIITMFQLSATKLTHWTSGYDHYELQHNFKTRLTRLFTRISRYHIPCPVFVNIVLVIFSKIQVSKSYETGVFINGVT